MSNRPKAVEVTFREGGEWVPFPCKHLMRHFYPTNILVHAIKFDDGSVWAASNGWRTYPAQQKKVVRTVCTGICNVDANRGRSKDEDRYIATPWGLFEPATGTYKAT